MIQLIFRSLTQPHGQFGLHQPAACMRHVICLGKCNRSTVKVSIRRRFVGNVFSASISFLKTGITLESFRTVILKVEIFAALKTLNLMYSN